MVGGLQGVEESTWILVLETACHPHASPAFTQADGTVQPSSSESSSDPDGSSGNHVGKIVDEAWKNHSMTANLQCDIALFPNDTTLTLSRQAFLDAVQRLPQQTLHPCGTENVFVFSSLHNTTATTTSSALQTYHMKLTSCHFQGTSLFADTLPLVNDGDKTTTNTIVWEELDTTGTTTTARGGSMEPRIARTAVTFHLQEARRVFVQQWNEVRRRVPDRHTIHDKSCGTNATRTTTTTNDVTMLLEALTAKIESDVQAVDQVLIFFVMMGVVTIVCLIKLVFFETSSSSRRGHRGHRLSPPTDILYTTPTPRAPQSPWLAGASGVGTGTLSFPTPSSPRTGTTAVPTNTTLPSSVGGSTSGTSATTATPNMTTASSPCHVLVTEWMDRKNERRRRPHRWSQEDTTHGTARRRLIPTMEDEGTETEEQPDKSSPPGKNTDTTKSTDTTHNDDKNHCTSNQKGQSSSALSPTAPSDGLPQKTPEQHAQDLWGFGMRF